ncbi:MAG TPA: hypothetical protein ENN23_10045 [Deltaproteobacteria bacterium]|nr:hypothetical protein [Deltaproteobacteria bacterium]
MAITVDDIKKMSPQAKALAIVVIFLVLAALYYVYFFSNLQQKKAALDRDIETLEMQIKEKARVAAQLDQYKADVEALQQNYAIALKKLPDQREIPGLFHSVATSGKETGVEFLLFEPRPAVPKTMAQESVPAKKPPPKGKKAPAPEPEPFYQEIPVRVSVTGSYQSILHFFEKVAKLPRIVNVSDITMGDRRDVKGRGYIITSTCTIKTYMFIDKK